MKKIIITVVAILAALLLMTVFVAQMTQSEAEKIFSNEASKNRGLRLISYQSGLFKATAQTEFTLMVEGKAIVFIAQSNISHYPYKAVIHSNIKMQDEQLNKQLVNYFGSEQWLSSVEEVDLLGQAQGQLTVAAGELNEHNEQLKSGALSASYQVDLSNYSGVVNIEFAGGEVKTADQSYQLGSFKLLANITSKNEYNYQLSVAQGEMKNSTFSALLEEVVLQGDSKIDKEKQRISSSTVLQVSQANFVSDNTEKQFSDNRIIVSLNHLSLPLIEKLSEQQDEIQSEQAVELLTQLLAHGGQLLISDLHSQSPWGEIKGELDLTLQQGLILSQWQQNPFIVLDHLQGKVQLSLPEKLLQEAALNPLLQTALDNGVLIKNSTHANLELQGELKQGALILNGVELPL